MIEIFNNGRSMKFRDGRGPITLTQHCLEIFKWAEANPWKKTNLSEISKATGVPRMSLHWIFYDAYIRRNKSVIYKAARFYGYKYRIDHRWNTINKYKRRKLIIYEVKKTL